MKCPKCGHEFKAPAQKKGGRNRWSGMTTEERAAEMSRVRRKGLAKGGKAGGAAKRRGDSDYYRKLRAKAGKKGSAIRFERSKWPHPKFPKHMKLGLLPDVIWLRIDGEEVTGWQSTDPVTRAGKKK